MEILYIYVYIELSTAIRFELLFITKHHVSRFHRSSVVKRKLTYFTKQFCYFSRWKYCRFSCIELQLKQLWDRKKMNKKTPSISSIFRRWKGDVLLYADTSPSVHFAGLVNPLLHSSKSLFFLDYIVGSTLILVCMLMLFH